MTYVALRLTRFREGTVLGSAAYQSQHVFAKIENRIHEA